MMPVGDDPLPHVRRSKGRTVEKIVAGDDRATVDKDQRHCGRG